MRALKLTETVNVEGRTKTGLLRADLTIRPSLHDGWRWNGNDVSRVRAERRFREVCLEDGPARFRMFEHVGALFATGLTGIELVPSVRAPRFSRTLELWEKLKPKVVETDQELTFWSTNDLVAAHCGEAGSGRYITIQPNYDGKLHIKVCIDYPDIGVCEQDYCFPDMELLERVFAARTLGRWPLEAVVRHLTILPVVRDANWAGAFRGETEKARLLRLICDHRALDILGALCLLVPSGGYLSANVTSVRGGHECDVKVVNAIRAAHTLVRVG